MIKNYSDTDTLLEEKVVTKTEKEHSIVVYNDDVNTFEWVIFTLIGKCKHTMEQAEQCALIIHNTGKCSVKKGSVKDLKPIHEGLLDAGLSSEIV